MIQHYGAAVAVVGGATLLQLANTIFAVVLPLQLALGGFSGTTTGIVTTAYGVGFLAGCFAAPTLIRDVGHIRAFAVLAAVCAVVSLIFGATRLVPLWFVLRLLMGFCQAGLFTVVEGWLAAATPAPARGRVLAFYMVTTKVAIVGGHLALSRLDAAALLWFEVASAVFSLSLVPVALTRTPAPPPPHLELLRPHDLYRVAPAAIVGCLGSGLLNSAALGLTPIYGTRLGLPVGLIVLLLSLAQLGSLLLQWPLGWLSDRVDRRVVIVGCAMGVAALSLLIMSAAGAARPWLGLLFFLWGGCSLSFYAVAVAHASDFARADQMVGVSSGTLLAWAVGAAIGPTLAAPFIDLLGPGGLFVYTALVAAALALFVLWRMTRRSPVPVGDREGFVNLPATSPRLAEIDPRVPERPT